MLHSTHFIDTAKGMVTLRAFGKWIDRCADASQELNLLYVVSAVLMFGIDRVCH